MQDNRFHEMTEKLVTHAITGEATKFELLRSWQSYRYYKSLIKAYASILGGLTKGADRLYKSYCRDVTKGVGTTSKVTAYKQMLGVLSFYKNEISTISDMVKEYKLYLLDGHLINSFLGIYRSDQDLRNYLED